MKTLAAISARENFFKIIVIQPYSETLNQRTNPDRYRAKKDEMTIVPEQDYSALHAET
jgi:hypothetical protein